MSRPAAMSIGDACEGFLQRGNDREGLLARRDAGEGASELTRRRHTHPPKEDSREVLGRFGSGRGQAAYPKIRLTVSPNVRICSRFSLSHRPNLGSERVQAGRFQLIVRPTPLPLAEPSPRRSHFLRFFTRRTKRVGGWRSPAAVSKPAPTKPRQCPALKHTPRMGVPRVGQAAAARACLSLNHPRSRGGWTALNPSAVTHRTFLSAHDRGGGASAISNSEN